MLLNKIFPVNNPLVVKYTIAEFADAIGPLLEQGSALHRLGQHWKNTLKGAWHEMNMLLVVRLQQARPHGEAQFRNDAPGRYGFVVPGEVSLRFSDLLLCPGGQVERVVPSFRAAEFSQRAMHRVTEAYLAHL